MAGSVKKTGDGKRRRRPPKAVGPVQYVIAVEAWQWSFSFGVNRMSAFSDPYGDYRHLEITGALKRPLMPKVSSVSATLMPDIRLNESERQKDRPQNVGSINARGTEFSVLLSLPADALASIIAGFHAGKIRYVIMEGEKLRYGQGLVTNYRLDRIVDYDDEP